MKKLLIVAEMPSQLWQFLYECDLSPHARKTYQTALNHFFKWTNDNYREVDFLSTNDILKYLQFLVYGDLTSHTCQSYFRILKLYFRWLSDKEIHEDIAANIPVPKAKPEKQKKQLSNDQVIILFESIDKSTFIGFRDYSLMILFFSENFIPLKCLDIKIGDVKLINGFRCLQFRNCDPGRIKITSLKDSNGESYRLFADARTYDVLKKLIDIRKQLDPNLNNDSYLFSIDPEGSSKAKLSPSELEQMVNSRLVSIGLSSEYECRSDEFYTQSCVSIAQKHLEYILKKRK